MVRYIYKITSPTGRIYIGQTKSPNKRKHDYKRLRCKGQPKIYNSIKKHGWDNHTFEIIETIDHSTNCATLTDISEEHWIIVYNSIDLGLNVDLGGRGKIRVITGRKMPDTTRKAIAKSRTGVLHDAETKNEISKSVKLAYVEGRLNNKGQKRSKKHKQQQKERRILEVVTGKDKRCKKIGQYDLDWNLIKTWNSIGEAAAAGYQKSGIILVCKNKRNRTTCNGYKWKYAE